MIHAHNCPNQNTQCAAGIFSPEDMVYMAQVFLNGYAKDTNNLFFGVANTNFPYIVKITNAAKFRTFAQAIAGDQGKMNEYINKYEKKLRSSDPSMNELNFLNMLNDYGVRTGLALYRSTTNCVSWMQLGLGASGSIEIPCE